MKQHPIYIIVAVDKNNGIGKDGKLPWHFKKELQYFKDTTTKTEDPSKLNMVIMGRTTWESIPEKFRPLPSRHNVILTKNKKYKAEATVAHSLHEAIEHADETIEKIFIIGGAQVFKESLSYPELDGIYLTKINHSYDCDTHFETIPHHFSATEIGSDSEDGVSFSYMLFTSSKTSAG